MGWPQTSQWIGSIPDSLRRLRTPGTVQTTGPSTVDPRKVVADEDPLRGRRATASAIGPYRPGPTVEPTRVAL